MYDLLNELKMVIKFLARQKIKKKKTFEENNVCLCLKQK